MSHSKYRRRSAVARIALVPTLLFASLSLQAQNASLSPTGTQQPADVKQADRERADPQRQLDLAPTGKTDDPSSHLMQGLPVQQPILPRQH